MSARTAARSALVLVALAIALAVGALLGVAASPSTADAVQVPAPAVQAPAVEAPALAADPFLAALLGKGTELPPNAAELSDAADRVCEGHVAGVSTDHMVATIAAEFAVPVDDATGFVMLAGALRCGIA